MIPFPHGVFTSALLKTLRKVPQDEPAVEVFQSVKAIMQSEGLPQEPVLAGTLERRKRALLGGEPGEAGRTIVALLRVRRADTVEMQGGLALGIRPGAELAQIAPPAGKQPVRLRVIAVTGLSQSTAVATGGSAAALPPGTQFTVDGWVAPTGEALRVWLPPARLGVTDLAAVATELARLRGAERIEWVEDPVSMDESGAPLYTVQPGAAGWELLPPAGAPIPLGATIRASEVAAAIHRQSNEPVRLLVLLPPSTELRQSLHASKAGAQSAVQQVTDKAGAQYLLVGRVGAEGPEYAWVLPNATARLLESSALSVRTDWIPASDSAPGRRLDDLALRLAKLRAWLRLESPPDNGAFPYHLALRNTNTGAIVTEGPLHNGEGYGLVLRADPARLRPALLEKRRVYVFAIDSRGSGVLLYPRSDVQNRFPLDQLDEKYPAEIQLGDAQLFTIGPPFGVDTYIMLTSDEAISTDALAWEGVRTRGAGGSALATLLRNTGAATRAPEPVTPAHWSVERLTIKSVP